MIFANKDDAWGERIAAANGVRDRRQALKAQT